MVDAVTAGAEVAAPGAVLKPLGGTFDLGALFHGTAARPPLSATARYAPFAHVYGPPLVSTQLFQVCARSGSIPHLMSYLCTMYAPSL